ncbi:MAG: response regulator [Candidatus Omnitrophota bacterium]|jgi:CheY-like chemotaxis protein
MDKQIKILLVDDEPDFLESMSFWFKSKGFLITTVSNGKDATKMVKAFSPDAVFLDILLPGIDGIAVLQQIREFNKSVPVILMSAYVRKSIDAKKDNLYGASQIFYKEDGFPKALELLESALKK